MKRLLPLFIAILCTVGCKDDFRAYEYTGSILGPDGEYYDISLSFMPTGEGEDVLFFSQDGTNREGGIIYINDEGEACLEQQMLEIKYIIDGGGIVRRHGDCFTVADDEKSITVGSSGMHDDAFSIVFGRGAKVNKGLYR